MKKIQLQLTQDLSATCDTLNFISHLLCGTKNNLDDSGDPLYEVDEMNNSVTIQASDGCYDDVKEALENKGFKIITPQKAVRILDPEARKILLSSTNSEYGFLENELPTTYPNLNYSTKVTYLDFSEFPITYINDVNGSLTNNCTALKTLIFPDACKTIYFSGGYGAGGGIISRCTALERLDLGGVETIYTCGFLCYSKRPTVIVIPNLKEYSCTYWGFASTTGATEKLVVGSIEQFLACYFATADFTYNSPKLYIVGDEENNITEITIPSTLSEIKLYALYNMNSITKIVFPESIVKVGYQAFFLCTGLTTIEFPSVLWWLKCTFNNEGANPMTYVQKMILNGKAVSSIDMNTEDPDKEVTSISTYNQAHNLSLNKFTTHSGVISIEEGAFKETTNLSTIKLNDEILSIGNYAFYKSGILSFTLPEQTSTIGSYTFLGCTSLKTVTMNTSVSVINNYTFLGCTNLSKLVVPDAVTIGTYMNNGSGMKTLDLGPKLTSIGEELYNGDSQTVRALIIRNYTSIPSVDTGNFKPTHIFVPYNIIDRYKLKDATWKAYASIIYPIGGNIWQGIYGTSNVYADLNSTEESLYNTLYPNLYTNYTETYITPRDGSITSLEIQLTDSNITTKVTPTDKTITAPKGKFLWLYSNFDNNQSDLITGNVTWSSGITSYDERYSIIQAGDISSVTCNCNELSDTVSITTNDDDSYIYFEDPEIVNIIFSKGYNDGVTKEGVTEITSIEQWFWKNTNIKKFNEFLYFTGVTSSNIGFSNCTNLEEITLPMTLTSLNNLTGYVGMFTSCTNLKRVDLGGVNYVGYYHHFEGAKIKALVIHDSIKFIGDERKIFPNLEKIIVEDIKNLLGCTFVDLNHCFTRDGLAQLYYTTDEETPIGTSANPLIIPSDVTAINAYALYNIPTITNLQYEGTSTEWNAISKGTSWNYNLGTSTIHCNGDNVDVNL